MRQVYKIFILNNHTRVELLAFQQALAKRIRTLREEIGLRQEDLEEYGVPWKTLQDVEYGKTDLKLSTLLKLAQAFRMTVSQLLNIDHPVTQ